MNTQDASNSTFQMLWDCKHCGTTKLLGLTHRHCPACGAPQNAETRYFPADHERVAVTGHRYVGKDIACRYCQAYNARESQHCGDCGSPLAEGKDGLVQADQVHAPGQFLGNAPAQQRAWAAGPAPAAKPKRRWLWVVLAALSLLVLLAVFWKRDAQFTVLAHSWSREIDVERFGPVRESAWCDQLPAEARVLGKARAVRSQEKVQVGEDCNARKVDQGDGTFREVQECQPRYEQKPVEDDKCTYEINRWATTRTASAQGHGLVPEPQWPASDTGPSCTQVGCLREGQRRETYVVQVRAANGDESDCELDAPRWGSFRVGQNLSAEVAVLGGRLVCDSLTAP